MALIEDEYRKSVWPPKPVSCGCEDWKEVRLLEALLDVHGYPVLNDGIFAESLTKKVKQFQRDFGLPETGEIGASDWQALLKV